jgi:membrane protease YdiL (CAAX protease family)
MDSAVPPIIQPTETPRPWGFWGTLGFSLVITVVYVLAQAVVVIAFSMVGEMSGNKLDPKTAASDGLLLATATCLAAPVSVGLVCLFAVLRRGPQLKEYLGLKWVTAKEFSRWLILLLILVVASDALTSWLDKPIVPEFMLNTYLTAGFVPLLWLALIIAAPFSEEFLFRGFMLEGFSKSKLGPTGAIMLTASAWSALHIQYDVYGIVSIFVSGLLLGYVRLKTGSLYLCIALHGAMNFIATLEVMALVHLFGGGLD